MKPCIFTDLFIVALVALFLASCGKDPVPGPGPNPVPGGAGVKIGSPALPGLNYKWACTGGAEIDNPSLAQPTVKTKCTVTCEVTTTNNCGVAKSSMKIQALKKNQDGALEEIKCPLELETR